MKYYLALLGETNTIGSMIRESKDFKVKVLLIGKVLRMDINTLNNKVEIFTAKRDKSGTGMVIKKTTTTTIGFMRNSREEGTIQITQILVVDKGLTTTTLEENSNFINKEVGPTVILVVN